MPKDETKTGNKRFSVTGVQRERNIDGDIVQFFLDVPTVEEAYQIGKNKAHGIIGANSVVRVCEVEEEED